MGTTLNRTGEQRPIVNKGHGTKALGPSDSSDSGSDVVGGPGLSYEAEAGIGIDHEAKSDSIINDTGTAGPDVGDANLDSDSDSAGTGERAAVDTVNPVKLFAMLD